MPNDARADATGLVPSTGHQLFFFSTSEGGSLLRQLWPQPPEALALAKRRPEDDDAGEAEADGDGGGDDDDTRRPVERKRKPTYGTFERLRPRRQTYVPVLARHTPGEEEEEEEESVVDEQERRRRSTRFDSTMVPELKDYGCYLVSLPCRREDDEAPAGSGVRAATGSIVRLTDATPSVPRAGGALTARALKPVLPESAGAGTGMSPGWVRRSAASAISKRGLRDWKEMDSTGEVSTGGTYEGRWKLEEETDDDGGTGAGPAGKRQRRERAPQEAVEVRNFKASLRTLSADPAMAPVPLPEILMPSRRAARNPAAAEEGPGELTREMLPPPSVAAPAKAKAPTTSSAAAAGKKRAVAASAAGAAEKSAKTAEAPLPSPPPPLLLLTTLEDCGRCVLDALRSEGRTSAAFKELERLILKKLPDYAAVSLKARDAATKQEAAQWFRTRQQELKEWLQSKHFTISPEGMVSF